MTIPEMIAEWRKGCSNSISRDKDGRLVQHLDPERCPACTVALIEAIERKAQAEAEPVGYRIEVRPGDYSFMGAKYWKGNRSGYPGARVHEVLLGPLVYEPGIDEDAALLFPSLVEDRLKAAFPLLYPAKGARDEAI